MLRITLYGNVFISISAYYKFQYGNSKRIRTSHQHPKYAYLVQLYFEI